MKRRTVTLTLWRIARDANPPDLPATDPAYLPPAVVQFDPSKAELGSFLNKIFTPQLNITFQVQIKNDTVRRDLGETGRYLVNTDNAFGGEFSPIKEKCFDINQDINIYVPANSIGIVTPGSVVPMVGFTHLDSRSAIAADQNSQTPAIEVMDTIAHEIGHVMFGAGHPDHAFQPGVAPLKDTDHSRHLMASGYKRRIDGTSCRLVKEEWDRAEVWLKIRPAGDH